MCTATRETVWTFRTADLAVSLELEPCQTDPADSFDDPDDVESVRSGQVAWFDAVVCVRDIETGALYGADALGACAYSSAEEFYTSHRDPDPMNRNCSAMRAAHGGNVVICHYFPDMVYAACREAREAIARVKSMHLRAA